MDMDVRSIGIKIKSLRNEKELTQTELGDMVGIAASTIQRYEAGLIKRPKCPVLNSIANALGTDINDLTDGAVTKLGAPKNVFSADFKEMVSVPVIGRVAAGLACHAENYVEGYEQVSPDSVTSGDDYVFLRVTGDSMSPMIMEGDLVLVRCQDIVDSGTYAVVIIDDEDGVVKRVILSQNKITLISENPYYPPRVFEGTEMSRIRIFGKVTEIKRKLI
ncbi:MAG: XRE family transcriptional regulator [Oscillospiraceae bacterium]|nr:XRE family transcriptional regulator [Oscillospiraceae bacterium]